MTASMNNHRETFSMDSSNDDDEDQENEASLNNNNSASSFKQDQFIIAL